MTRAVLRGWFAIHRWTSLACTAFLLLLCLTGLPLIFHDEIDRALGGSGGQALVGPPSSSLSPRLISLDHLVSEALRRRPGEVPLYVGFSNDSPLVTVTTGPTPDAPAASMTLQLFDRTTGRVVGRSDQGVTAWLLRLHTDLLLGLPGELLLGAMALVFLAAIISGAVLYAPFMRRLAFGTVRVSRGRRVRWIDRHNLLGVVTLAWAAAVGLTGAINAFEKPLTAIWQARELAAMTRGYAGRPALPPARYGSLDRAVTAARRVLPAARLQFIAFPGTAFSSPYHYGVFLQGGTPVTQRLLTPALVDAASGRLTDSRAMPWYMQTLAFAQPLHFGDYGGLPMKIVWALLDLLLIAVLGSGLHLWAGRRRATLDALVREVETAGRAALSLEHAG